MQLVANIDFVMSYSITCSKHNILFGASIKKCLRLGIQYTRGDIFGFKNDSGFTALKVFGFTELYIQYYQQIILESEDIH